MTKITMDHNYNVNMVYVWIIYGESMDMVDVEVTMGNLVRNVNHS